MLFTISKPLHSQYFHWAKQIHDAHISSILLGEGGDFYVSGSYLNGATFDPGGPNEQTLPPPTSNASLYIAKYSKSVPPKDMVLIPAGTFRMGSDSSEDEKPVHGVKIDAFYMEKYEVSVAEYAKFVNERHVKPGHWDEQLQKLNRPVVYVSWSDAQAYATWARKRLPTEAEWEYAARGGLEQKKYPWGNENPDGKANYNKDLSRGFSWKDANKYLKDVNSYEPNSYSLYNMSGNVWEWCSDWYSGDYYKQFANSVADNPRGPKKGTRRVLRGGSWSNSGYGLRVAVRNRYGPDYGLNIIGFRCVQDR